MRKMPDSLVERRRYIRLALPLDISYLAPRRKRPYDCVSKNISFDGLRFETRDKGLAKDDIIELKLCVPGLDDAVHAKGKVVWKRKISLEDRAPFDVGVEFAAIEEGDKNKFLKFLCDAVYGIREENADEGKEKRRTKN